MVASISRVRNYFHYTTLIITRRIYNTIFKYKFQLGKFNLKEIVRVE